MKRFSFNRAVTMTLVALSLSVVLLPRQAHGATAKEDPTGTHTVLINRGDTLSSIALTACEHPLSWKKLGAFNSITEAPYTIYAGKSLRAPCSAKAIVAQSTAHQTATLIISTPASSLPNSNDAPVAKIQPVPHKWLRERYMLLPVTCALVIAILVCLIKFLLPCFIKLKSSWALALVSIGLVIELYRRYKKRRAWKRMSGFDKYQYSCDKQARKEANRREHESTFAPIMTQIVTIAEPKILTPQTDVLEQKIEEVFDKNFVQSLYHFSKLKDVPWYLA